MAVELGSVFILTRNLARSMANLFIAKDVGQT